MRISTRLRIAALVPLIMALAIAGGLVYSYRSSIRLQEQERTAYQVSDSLGELNDLARTYALRHEERPKQQFLLKHGETMRLILDAEVGDPVHRRLLGSIGDETALMGRLFQKLKALEERERGSADTLAAEADERLVAQLFIRSRDAKTDATRLATLIGREIDATERRAYLLVAAAVALMASVLTVALLGVMRSITASLAVLEDGTEAVGSGNLEYRIGMSSPDELGRLARAFDRMTGQLQLTTASRDEIESERARLRTIIDTMPVGVSLLGAGGDLLQVNEATARIWRGAPEALPADIEGYSAYKAFSPETGRRLEPGEWPAARALATGETVTGELLDIERFDGSRGSALVSATPLRGGDGSIVGAVAAIQDVTERRERERLGEALTQISANIGATLDAGEIRRRLALGGAQALRAQAAMVILRKQDRWAIAEAVAAVDEGISGAGLDGRAAAALGRAALERRPVELRADETAPPGSREVLEELDAQSLLSVPLLLQGEVGGAIVIVRRGSTGPFSHPEIDFAEELMSVASLALKNARLYEREHNIAETLQQAVLAPLEPIRGIEVYHLYQPASGVADVGGDFYDVFAIDEDKTGLVVGDISGKGLEAARLTSLVRDGIRAYSYVHAEPTWVLQHVNRLVHRSSAEEAFATVFFGVLDQREGTLSYCTAGHPPAVVLGPDGVRTLPISRSGMVGAFPDTAYHAEEERLSRGESLLLYTDGVTEARQDSELFGETRLVSALDRLRGVPTSEVPERLLDEVLRFSGGRLRDDTVVLCVRFIGLGEPVESDT